MERRRFFHMPFLFKNIDSEGLRKKIGFIVVKKLEKWYTIPYIEANYAIKKGGFSHEQIR